MQGLKTTTLKLGRLYLIERIVNLQGLKTACILMILLMLIERIVNLQGLKTLNSSNTSTLRIERIVNLPTHIGELTMFAENKELKQKQKISINKSK